MGYGVSGGTLKALPNLKVRLVCPNFPVSLIGSICAVSIMPGLEHMVKGRQSLWASVPSALPAASTLGSSQSTGCREQEL